MRRWLVMLWFGLGGLGFSGCAPGTAGGDPSGGQDDAAGSGGSDPGARPGADTPGSGSPATDSPLPSPPVTGADRIPLTLTSDLAACSDCTVSLGVPLPPGLLKDSVLLRVLDEAGAEVPVHVLPLATWPRDRSLRSALVAFQLTLAKGARKDWTVSLGAPRTQSAADLAPNPDGPVSAILAPDWYAASRVIGYQLSAASNQAFQEWEAEMDRYLQNMSPAWESYRMSCGTTSAERTYYDSPHALFQRFIHRGTAATYRRARAESTWYRANELLWRGDTAIYACETGYQPGDEIDWGTVRRMLGQGMLDDYLLTGDPEARKALKGLGEAFRQSHPANKNMYRITERNLAWPMMGMAAYYAVEQTAEVKGVLGELVDIALGWQAASGAFEHDIVRPDPSECGDGPNGASPFMTSLLVDGLIESYFLLEDARIPAALLKAAAWYRDRARRGSVDAFQYLWNCRDTDYLGDDSFDPLNLLIVHVFGVAYLLSQDQAWLDFGDRVASLGIEVMYGGAPKQWTQCGRSFL